MEMTRIRKARIAHTVTYVDENGQRRAIPKGPCEVIEPLALTDRTFIVRWTGDDGKVCEQKMTDTEIAQYEVNKALKFEDED